MDTIFFFGIDGEYGYLSNWFPCNFELEFHDKKYEFKNVEQGMMASKAILFKDEETFKKILNTSNPKSVKALGRKVKNFNEKVWDKYKKTIVKTVVMSKFKYNPDLLRKLIATGEKYLAEDSPYDKTWGIGTKSKKLKDTKKWPGQNLLGIILMEVRKEFTNQKM